MSARTCDSCGESFETLTRLRLHEKDDCPERETYAAIDPGSPDVGHQAGEGLVTCRNCGRENSERDHEYATSFASGDLHYIITFACRFCGFENENRVVMEGVDRSDLEKLPAHLQPTDGGSG